jgi:hypothetical protein
MPNAPHQNLCHVGEPHIPVSDSSHCPAENIAENTNADTAIRKFASKNISKFLIITSFFGFVIL